MRAHRQTTETTSVPSGLLKTCGNGDDSSWVDTGNNRSRGHPQGNERYSKVQTRLYYLFYSFSITL